MSRSESGSSLVLILVVLAIVAMAGIAGLQLYLDNKKFSESIVDSTDMTALENVVGSVLQNEDSCRIALGGPLVYGGPIDSAKANVFDPTGATSIQLWDSSQANVFLKSSDVNKTYTWGREIISKIELVPVKLLLPLDPVPVPPFYIAKIAITSAGRSRTGAQVIVRDNIQLNIEINASKQVVSCRAITFLGTDRLALPVCLAGQALYSNGKQIRCVQALCPAGKQPTGLFFPDGSIRCSP